MGILVYAMVYAGSALMVYNIIRYYQFMKQMHDLSEWESIGKVAPIPFVLLILFLAGYLSVGLFGKPDLVIGGILFGGSIYVFIVLAVLMHIIRQMKDNSVRVSQMYTDAKSNLHDLTKDCLSVLRVNLSKDTIEERGGLELRASDREAKTYTELLENRRSGIVSSSRMSGKSGLFSRKSLLACFMTGRMEIEETLYCDLPSGQRSFVRLQAKLAEHPETGDVIAFITENACNEEVVNETILNKALIEQYDMITYLADGRYGVVIGDGARIERGSIFPHERTGSYDEYLKNQVAPVISGDEAQQARLLEALSLASVEEALDVSEPYEVNVPCHIGGETFYKHFVFYAVDKEAKFYIVLKSDTTEARREEMERNEKLSAALEEAQRASRSKTTFLSNMSHDIRTPMNAIVGYTEFAKKSDSLDVAHEYLEKIDASSKYLLALVNDVLEMSRIESGKIDLYPEPCDLVKVMNDVRDMFETQMAEKHIAYTVDTADVDCGRVLCDRNRLNRVLLNLLSNAYKFTPDGGAVSVRLTESASGKPGFAAYELRVKDTGIGMSQEFADRVFDAFERERNTTTSGIQGTGLGMAISKRLVDMMGGSIEVKSEQGKGTEFIVRLDFELDDDAGASPSSSEDTARKEELGFSQMRVILAEDNEINREIASMILEELGFEVDEAVNGQEALNLLTGNEPGFYDLVVTDIQMPVLDGYGEARAIRALDDPALAAIPIIAMSANAFQEDVQASKEAGIDAHIAKPVDMGALVDTLADVLAK